jgi:hypothetical protein
MPTDLFLSPTACRCEECSPHDVGPTYSRQHLLECEARHVAQLKGPDPETRNERRSAYLGGVYTERGVEAYATLRSQVWVQMNKLGITP